MEESNQSGLSRCMLNSWLAPHSYLPEYLRAVRLRKFSYSLIAAKLAKDEGVAESGYRLIINNGSEAGQEVFHLHLHLMGGRRMRLMG